MLYSFSYEYRKRKWFDVHQTLRFWFCWANKFIMSHWPSVIARKRLWVDWQTGWTFVKLERRRLQTRLNDLLKNDWHSVSSCELSNLFQVFWKSSLELIGIDQGKMYEIHCFKMERSSWFRDRVSIRTAAKCL